MCRLLPHSLLLLASASGLFGCRTLPATSGAFERTYTDRLRLTAEEERRVVALAAETGVTKIATIETDFAQPGFSPFILVTEAETSTGRVVSYRTVRMYWKTSPDHREYDPAAEGTKPKGRIVAHRTVTFEKAILKLGEKEYRVTLGDAVTPSDAEAILACFHADRFHFIRKPTVEEDYIRINDFSDPSTIKFDNVRGLHVVTFDSKESSRSSSYYGSLKGNTFEVHKVVTIQFG